MPVKPAPKIKLSECYVLIEKLVIPAERGIQIDSTKDILQVLDLDVDNEEENLQLNESEEKQLKKQLDPFLKNKIL